MFTLILHDRHMFEFNLVMSSATQETLNGTFSLRVLSHCVQGTLNWSRMLHLFFCDYHIAIPGTTKYLPEIIWKLILCLNFWP